jgi:uncharacterized repeat protein (TIGR03847 family)
MTRRTYDFDEPDRFLAGAVGQPGRRTFFLQARQGRRLVSVVLEKDQVAVLAERLGRLLTDLEAESVLRLVEPAATPAPGEPGSTLEEPLEPVFRAGTLAFGFDAQSEAFVVEVRADSEADGDDEDDEDEPVAIDLSALVRADMSGAALEAEDPDEADVAEDPDGPDVMRIRLSAAATRDFVEGALRVVRAGRPPCPMCGNPLDPGGHICPRRNGNYVH